MGVEKSSSKSGGRSAIVFRIGSAKSVTHSGYGVGEGLGAGAGEELGTGVGEGLGTGVGEGLGVGVIDTRFVAMVSVVVGVAVARWKAMAGN